jgi:zinc protease
MNEKPRKVFDVPIIKKLFAVESDKEASSAQVQLLYKDYAAPKKMVNLGDFKIT